MFQVQNDSETEPGATERVVTLIGIKKVTDMAYELIKEVIDEVWLLSEYFQIKSYACVRLVESIYVVIVCYCIRLCGRVSFDLLCRLTPASFCDVLSSDRLLGPSTYTAV